MRIIAVVGARPNFMKIAPILWEIEKRSDISAYLVHTGQHYDQHMSQLFFNELGISEPEINLEVGSGSHAVQTAEIMKRFEPIVQAESPDALVVVGDVNSTIACALTAVKLGVPVAHVEAGLRSFDRSMPEEINRVLTDAISSWLFVSEASGLENLRREGVQEERIFFVGNTMIDTLLALRNKSESSTVLERVAVTAMEYALLTLHRPANVDSPAIFSKILAAVSKLQERIPVVFPVHPRTRRALAEQGLPAPRLITTEPLGYLDFVKLLAHARFVMTDSGGVQEEATVLDTPCLTLRDNTERPCTLNKGTNRLVGRETNRIIEAAEDILDGERPRVGPPEKWDGFAARRIVEVLLSS